MTWDELLLAVKVRTDAEDFPDLELLEQAMTPEARASDRWAIVNQNYITRTKEPT